MKRRGFLLAEFTLKIIVAVISIVILIGLLYGIYSIFSSSSEIKQAKASLDEIEIKINEASPIMNSSFVLVNPKNWDVIYFVAGNPIRCAGESCLCICEEPDNCDEKNKGACKAISSVVLDGGSFAIEEPIELKFEKEGGNVTIRR